jgi:hypothetical protein
VILLPRVTPQEFTDIYGAFTRGADYLSLTPYDRAVAWAKHTADKDFVQWPVPITQFVSDPYYIGPEMKTRVMIQEFLGEFWDPRELYEVFLFIAGIGAGKSISAILQLLYSAYVLSCLRDPLAYLSTFPGVQVSGGLTALVNTSAAGARQAVTIVYSEIQRIIDASPYFQQHFRPIKSTTKEILFPKRVLMLPGTSEARSVIGFNVFAAVVDEAAFGQLKDGTDTVRTLFLELNQRRRSRFGNLGWCGMFTSPGSESGFVEWMASQSLGIGEREILVKRTTTWEAKGELVPGCRVFLVETNPDRARLLGEPDGLPNEVTYLGRGLVQGDDGTIYRIPEASDVAA